MRCIILRYINFLFYSILFSGFVAYSISRNLVHLFPLLPLILRLLFLLVLLRLLVLVLVLVLLPPSSCDLISFDLLHVFTVATEFHDVFILFHIIIAHHLEI